jgi:hypothetical protein
MGILSGIFGLPLAPIKGVAWMAERLREEAERQYYDPASIQRQLEEVAAAKADGTLSEDDGAELERELVARLLEGSRRRREGY